MVSRPFKRVKRVVADYYSFHSFGTSACPAGDRTLVGPFRSNIKTFLLSYAEGPLPLKISSPSFIQRWRVRLRLDDQDEDVFIALNIVEEQVKRSDSVYCNHCSVVAGWHENPVCKTRYHFIIQADNAKNCTYCGAFVGSSASSRCNACDFEISRDTDLEDETRLILEDASHLLHGIIHVNGFGHLLRVNGREGGSQFLSGCDIMGLWDRICIMMKARKISVMDVSKKYGLDYRLLHAVQRGHPWYGNWGYEFGNGSFGITHESYKSSLQWLSKLPLDSVLSDVGRCDSQVKQIVSFYSSFSEKPLLTVQDLICFIMALLHKFHDQIEARKCSGNIMITMDKANINTESAEPKCVPKVVGEVTEAMLKVLRVANRSMWITWQDLRGATCHRRDPEILNYALTGLEGKTIGKGVVQCRCNSTARTLEYRLKDRESIAAESTYTSAIHPKQPMKEHVLGDLKTLYHALFDPLPTADLQRCRLRKQCVHASRKLLDCKQFIKDYEANHPIVTTDSDSIRVFVVAEILEEETNYHRPPPELLIMPKNATVADLKREAAQAFKDVYICFERFQVENIQELKNIKDSTNLRLLIGPGGVVTIQGRCGGDMSKYRVERGTQIWTVDCPCGTRVDDGERMIACDYCEVWQHTRCVNISDTSEVPPVFTCENCGDNAEDSDDFEYSAFDDGSSVSSFY